MHNQRDDLRFERTALGFVVMSVVMLYAMVLSAHGGGALASVAFLGDGETRSVRVASVLRDRAILPESLAAEEAIIDLAELVLHAEYSRADVVEVAVRRVLVDRMPRPLELLPSANERKRAFVDMMLPLVLRVNEQILSDRRRLMELRGRPATLDPRERRWLEHLSRRYRLSRPDMDTLLRRVDVVPPSLALAQAAAESGWGTSRFAREGNALFGQQSSVAGSGLVPLRRDSDKTHEVKSFNRVVDSVTSYMTNLNSHHAYSEFRRLREDQRISGGFLDGYALAGTLQSYSERGDAYIGTIRSIIESNRLRAFDQARLGDEPDI